MEVGNFRGTLYLHPLPTTRLGSYRNFVLKEACTILLKVLKKACIILLKVLPVSLLILVSSILVLLVLSIVFTPLLIVALLLARLLQLIRAGDGFIEAIRWRYYIKNVIFLLMVAFLFAMVFCFPIVKYAPGLKDVMIVAVSFPNWLIITCMIFGFHMLGFLLSMCVHALFFLLAHSNEKNEYRISVAESVSEIINCLIFWWVESEVLKRVPLFKHYQILGLHTSKWIKVAIFSLIGYNCITLSTNAVMWLTLATVDRLSPRRITKHIGYYANGMRRSINFILSSLMLLLIWVSYFGSHLNQVAQAQRTLYIVTRTFASLLICSVLWLLKTFIVLAWEAQAVYSRLESKIQDIGWQLNFLFSLYYRGSPPTWSFSETSILDLCSGQYLAVLFQQPQHYDILKFKHTAVRNLYGIWQIGLCLLRAKHHFFTLSKDTTSEIIGSLSSDLQMQYRRHDYNPDRVEKLHLENFLRQEYEFLYWKEFELMLNEMNDSSTVSSSEETSIEKTRICLETMWDHCSILANTISSYVEMVNCLDNIMSWAIVGATFIMWLLLTKIASTKILVLIASPLLAASFAFGDTCKRLFQGIIFVYAVRPLEVGDECDVGEDSELRVISIGVWKTTFSKIKNGSRVQVMYPNSELANKRVLINSKFDIKGKGDRKSGIRDSKGSSDPQGSNKPAALDTKESNKPAVPDPEESNPEAALALITNPSVIATEPFTTRTRSMSEQLGFGVFYDN